VTIVRVLNAECIMLLITIIRKYNLEKSFSIDILSLAEESFSTKNTVIKLFKLLKGFGYVTTKEKASIRGRGKNIYTFTQAFKDELKNDLFIIKAWESDNPAVDTLLKNKVAFSKQDSEDTKLLLRSSNRLFLLIFILHADEFGVISNLSTTAISKLMGGITKDRFKSQLKTLYDIGIMKCHVSGVTGKELFGKIKGKYYLDLSNSLFYECYCNVSQLMVRVAGISDGNSFTEAGALFNNYRNYHTEKCFVWPSVIARYLEAFNFKNVIHFFNNQMMQEQFQLLLFNIASEILSNCWYEPDKFTHSSVVLKLLNYPMLMTSKKAKELGNVEGLKEEVDRIFNHEFGENVPVSEFTSNETAECYLELVWLIRKLSLSIANRYKLFLTTTLGKEVEMNKLMIMPITEFKVFEGEEYVELFEVFYIDGSAREITKLQVLEDKLEVSKNGKAFERHGLVGGKENISSLIDKMLLPS